MYTKKKESSFVSWLVDVVEGCLVSPAAVLHWFWDWRYPVLWISSLSGLYFSLIACAYYWHCYPENTLTISLAVIFLLLTLWGYYKHRKGRDSQPTIFL